MQKCESVQNAKIKKWSKTKISNKVKTRNVKWSQLEKNKTVNNKRKKVNGYKKKRLNGQNTKR